MPGRRLPLVLGLTFAVGCSSSSGVTPPGDGSSDAPSEQVRDAGAIDMPATTPNDDGADGPSGADGAAPQGDAPVDSSGVDTNDSNDAQAAGDGRDDSDSVQPSDAAGQEAADATQMATDAGAAGDASGVDPEAGRLAGITAAHNAVRAAVKTQPLLPPLVWNQAIADYAQQWATMLATTMCAQPQHRSGAELMAKGYGENLATFSVGGTPRSGMPATASTAEQAVSAWAAEVACWTFGTILGSETCDPTCYKNLHSDGCGHYTQVVWRASTQLGCGVATCANGALTEDIWICNYAPAGNVIGREPY